MFFRRMLKSQTLCRNAPMPPLFSSWDIDPRAFPEDGPEQDKLRFILRYALLAPSNHNTQPWRFSFRGNRLELFADRARSLPASDPFGRELVISCGAALAFLRLAAEAFGCRLAIRRFPDGSDRDLLAGVEIAETRACEPDLSVPRAILCRRTHRNAFDPAPITGEERRRLSACIPSGVRAGWIDDQAERAQLVRTVMAADRIQFENAAFLRELAAWIRPPLTSARDGIPARAIGISGFASYVAPLVIRTFDLGGNRAARDEELIRHSPGIVILSTPLDTPRDWLRCGEALGAFLLEAERLGLKVSYLNQPCEVGDLRFQLSLLDGVAESPQLILRIGRSSAAVAPSPRRTLEDCL